MARRVFFSFHYKPDNWRASQVRNMGVIEGNAPVSDNDWETITRGGDGAIQSWVAEQLKGKSCTVVLIGTNTAGRKWINHEIKRSWNDKKGVVGIYIHNLKDKDGNQTTKGKNPFEYVTMKGDGAKLSNIVKAYDPPYFLALIYAFMFSESVSTWIYNYIKKNIENWVEEAIKIRADY